MPAASQATSPSFHIETIDRRRISERDARAIAKLVVSIWPKPDRTVDSFTANLLTQWKDYKGSEEQHPRSFMIREAGRLIAHASIDPRTISTANGNMTILALARVCTDPSARGRKLGDAVVRKSFELADDGSFPFALFQTTPDVKPFYERLGATVVHNKFINSLAKDPGADPFWAEVRMRYPATGNWPTGEIDVRGPGW
jgi:predicted GNAT family N-acyltransferase